MQALILKPDGKDSTNDPYCRGNFVGTDIAMKKSIGKCRSGWCCLFPKGSFEIMKRMGINIPEISIFNHS